AEFRDPAFDRYVDLTLLQEALASRDSAQVADVALQLAEGERILLRPHKAVKADKLLALAVRLAAKMQDRATLDRLAKMATARGDKGLATQIEAARNVSRKP